MKKLEDIEVPKFITNLGEQAVETYVEAKRFFDDLHRRMGTRFYMSSYSSDKQIVKKVKIDGEECFLPLYLTKAFGL